MDVTLPLCVASREAWMEGLLDSAFSWQGPCTNPIGNVGSLVTMLGGTWTVRGCGYVGLEAKETWCGKLWSWCAVCACVLCMAVCLRRSLRMAGSNCMSVQVQLTQMLDVLLQCMWAVDHNDHITL